MFEAQMMVREFHKKYGHHVEESPTAEVDFAIRKLRAELIFEECDEVCDELHQAGAIAPVNLVKIADGLGDLLYVVLGTAVSLGIDLEPVFKEIHRSNMTKTVVKLEPGEKYGRGGGKGPGYEPPNIKAILAGMEIESQMKGVQS